MNKQPYVILAAGNFGPSEVTIDYNPEHYSPQFGAAETERICRDWDAGLKRAMEGGKNLFNGRLYHLNNIESMAGKAAERIVLCLGDTDYASYLGTRSLSTEGEEKRASPLGTAILLVTSDECLVLASRSANVDVNPGRLFSFGGFFDRDEDVGPAGPDLFGCAIRELHEELGIGIHREHLRLLGIVYDNKNPHPEACFGIRVAMSSADIIALGQIHEVSELFPIKLEILPAWIETHRQDICESLLGGLELFLASRLSSETWR